MISTQRTEQFKLRVIPTEVKKRLSDYLNTPQTQQMKAYMAHGNCDVYTHCLNVAVKSYIISRIIPVKISMDELLFGALFHDFYLYDWHIEDPKHKWHGKLHGHTAFKNINQYYVVSQKERDIIESHMWPKRSVKRPGCIEAWIVNTADKYCASQEFLSALMYKMRLHTAS